MSNLILFFTGTAVLVALGCVVDDQNETRGKMHEVAAAHSCTYVSKIPDSSILFYAKCGDEVKILSVK